MISVVIPALNEELALPATLNCLEKQPNLREVIVVDGGSDDATAAIVAAFRSRLPCLQLLQSERGRGRQMNAGARHASGDWLLFLHADTLLPENGLAAILESAEQRKIQAGCFKHRFSGQDWRLRLVSLAHNIRFHITGIIYGDQAMFVRRDLFGKLDGFPEELLEDILFSQRLLEQVRPVMLPLQVITDARKFEQMGVVQAMTQIVAILVRHSVNLPTRNHSFFDPYR